MNWSDEACANDACAEMVKRSHVGSQDAVAGEVKNGLQIAPGHPLTAFRILCQLGSAAALMFARL